MTAQSDDRLGRELALEQAHVDLVYEALGLATTAAQNVASEGQARYTSNRESWVREEDGTALFERDAFAFQAARRLAVLDAEHEGLVFGKLTLSDEPDRYIGRLGVRDSEFEPLVIDWRARAAEPFYRATPAEPMDVVRRRVLRCRNERVIGIEDDLLDTSAATDDLVVIGEGALMAALTRARGHQMRDIVATIQAEQDEAIRAPHAGVTIISGGPGTGKTVVGLHRTAYLLYSNRRRFENGGVLVVGPSPIFMNYIERVLPSLGEDSVTLRSLGSVASDVLPVRATRQDDPDAAAVKGSLRMLKVLRRLIATPLLPEVADLALRVTVKGEVLTLTAAQAGSIRREILADHQMNRAREIAENAILRSLWQQGGEDSGVEQEAFEELIRDQASFRMFMNAFWPSLTAADVLARLADRDLVAQVGDGILSAEEQAALAESYLVDGWSVADVALLDELVAVLGPAPEEAEAEPTLFLEDASFSELVTTADLLRDVREVDHEEQHLTYAHVLVDEAQDITPMQWRMLRRRGGQASWTIVGDPAQSSWPDPAEADRALKELIGTAPSRRFRLSTNYRSPAEVFELASQVILTDFPEADLPNAVRSTGFEPALLQTSEDELGGRLAEILQDLAASVEGTIGIVAAPRRLAATQRLVAEVTDGADERIFVLDPLAVKGLEYDAVVVLAPDEIVRETAGGVRTLYVALTRPTQRLVTLDLDTAEWRLTLGEGRGTRTA